MISAARMADRHGVATTREFFRETTECHGDAIDLGREGFGHDGEFHGVSFSPFYVSIRWRRRDNAVKCGWPKPWKSCCESRAENRSITLMRESHLAWRLEGGATL